MKNLPTIGCTPAEVFVERDCRGFWEDKLAFDRLQFLVEQFDFKRHQEFMFACSVNFVLVSDCQ